MNNYLNFLNKEKATNLLDIMLSTGSDFAEIFLEDTVNVNIEVQKDKVSKNKSEQVRGAALRILKGELELNAIVTDLNYDNLLESAKVLASNLSGEKIIECQKLEEKTFTKNVTIKRSSAETPIEEKIKMLLEINEGAQEASELVYQSTASMFEKNQNILVVASDGTYAKDTRSNLRASVLVIAKNEHAMETGSGRHGFNGGYEMYDGWDAREFGKKAAITAVTMLDADDMIGGDIPVVINNEFGGVILHEACVHSLEATSVAKGVSVFCGKLGTKIASDIVNAVDNGTDPNAWGSLNCDDEGTPVKNNVLIENGILKSYLVDKRNSRIMNHPITASSRRESYKFTTTSRMSNTYFLNGTSTHEEIIANTKYGLFAKTMGGGSVNPATGEFNFAVLEGYMIEDGKLTRPVKGATLIGSGKDVLQRIDMIANNLAHGHGMCGSMSGSIPTNVGQPTIRVSHITVGGKGGNK